jgi:hypothetical protein
MFVQSYVKKVEADEYLRAKRDSRVKKEKDKIVRQKYE